MLLKSICGADVEEGKMTTYIPLFKASVYFILILFSISSASPREHPGILSRLYKQASKQNRPLIIVLDNSAHGETNDVKYKTNLHGDKMSQPLYIYDLDQNSQPAKPKLPISELLENEHFKAEKRPIKKRVKQRYQLKNDDKKFLGSPVIKSLLRISNSLRCEAKNDCEDECNKNSEENREECEDECEIKYSCEESVEVKDEEQEMSTKGERLVTETPKCKRC